MDQLRCISVHSLDELLQAQLGLSLLRQICIVLVVVVVVVVCSSYDQKFIEFYKYIQMLQAKMKVGII